MTWWIRIALNPTVLSPLFSYHPFLICFIKFTYCKSVIVYCESVKVCRDFFDGRSMNFRMLVIFVIVIINIYHSFLNQGPFSVQVSSMELTLRPSFLLPVQFKVVYLIYFLCKDGKVAFPTQPEHFYFIEPYVHINII